LWFDLFDKLRAEGGAIQVTTWVQLPKETVHSFYRVPVELAGAEGNRFFGTEHHPLDADGPWPLLAFLRSEARPDVVTFQIFTLEAEALEAEGFNPLSETCGYLDLVKRQAIDLARLLSSFAERLISPPAPRRPMFEQLDGVKLGELRIPTPVVPGSREYVFRQTYDPENEPIGESTETLLFFSAGQGSRPAYRLYFKILRFPLRARADLSFSPLDHSLAKICLDRSGLEELAAILEVRQRELAG
jgi:hypothetical protein